MSKNWFLLALGMTLLWHAPAFSQQFAYVGNSYDKSISVFDVTKSRQTGIITGLSGNSNGVAISTDGGTVYSANDNGTVDVINATTMTVSKTYTISNTNSSHFIEPVLSPDGTRLYLSQYNTGILSIDPRTGQLMGSVTPSNPPAYELAEIAVDSTGTRLYAGYTNGTIVTISTSTMSILTTTATAIGSIRDLTLNPAGTRLYIVDGSYLYVYDTTANKVLNTITTANNPSAVRVSPNGKTVYVANQGSNSVTVIDATTNAATALVKVDSGPTYLAVSADGNWLFCANSYGYDVSIVSLATNQVVATPAEIGQDGSTRQPAASGYFIAPAAISSTGQLPETGWWWNPQEPGIGFSLEVKGLKAFIAGFMYANDGTPVWYTASGSFNSQRSLTTNFVQYSGGRTLNSGSQQSSQVGSVGTILLQITSPTTGTLTLGSATPISVQRFQFASNGVAAQSAMISRDNSINVSNAQSIWNEAQYLANNTDVATAVANGNIPNGYYHYLNSGINEGRVGGLTAQNGWWWNYEGGWGVYTEIQKNELFFAAYMYDSRGQAVWYISQGYLLSANTYTGDLIQYQNGNTFFTTNKTATVAADLGPMTLQYTDGKDAAWTLPNGTRLSLYRYNF